MSLRACSGPPSGASNPTAHWGKVPYRELNGLRELRLAVGKAQQDIAAALKIRQPSVSKLENQADMHLSTLRGYIEAVGGELELVVRLPQGSGIRLSGIGQTEHRRPAVAEHRTRNRAP